MYIISGLTSEQNQLFHQHINDAKAMVRSFYLPSWSSDDLDSLAFEALLYAAMHYDDTRGMKFTTYLFSIISYYIRSPDLLRKVKVLPPAQTVEEGGRKKRIFRQDQPVSLNMPTVDELTLVDLLEDLDLVKVDDDILYKDVLENVKAVLTDREWLIINKIAEGYLKKEVADMIGVTQPRMSTILKSIYEKVAPIVRGIDV